MIPENGVCAIVITFRPPAEAISNLRKFRSQVEGLIVVDNGSPTEQLMSLRSASGEIGFQLIENQENLGIGAALNSGFRLARSSQFRWVALFDQDSTINDGFIDSMLKEYALRARSMKVGIVAARAIDRQSGGRLHSWPLNEARLQVAQTSGSILPMDIVDEVGEFREDLFIDMVDFEYCLRARRHGYEIIECERAVLTHSPARPQSHSLFGLYTFTASNYGSERRYYIQRNTVWMIKHYWRDCPRFFVGMLAIRTKDLVKVLLVEENRLSKILGSFRGILDGFLGRVGKTVDL